MEKIEEWLGLKPDPNNVRPTMWRMKKDGRLMQDDEGRYHLPKKIEATDDLISRSTSAAPNALTTQQNRESGSGGGT